ncbi:hypothetical protein OS493_008145 [Desmophyllum pertusum]|uniref:Uncharacterized protein n=1 Tax=Desmophyllum pertusum TaxID=174260 RepID=A0A9X0DBQ3_9CNID|nr:hypothetical protein OS493_008145 [Desmophyllum pertusum]
MKCVFLGVFARKSRSRRKDVDLSGGLTYRVDVLDGLAGAGMWWLWWAIVTELTHAGYNQYAGYNRPKTSYFVALVSEKNKQIANAGYNQCAGYNRPTTYDKFDDLV